MKRIIIICEGQTEQQFCNDVLQPHLNSFGIFIQAPTIKKTGGGIVRWELLKKEILLHLQRDKSANLTTLFDYYGLHDHHQFPNWKESKNLPNRNERMSLIETGMLDSVSEKLRNRFIPYIQLHEFEGLLFSNISVIENEFEESEFSDYAYLKETVRTFENPEMINDGSTTAPSKRLERIIKGYNKPVFGSLLAEAIGLQKIREKCPRFNAWVNALESV